MKKKLIRNTLLLLLIPLLITLIVACVGRRHYGFTSTVTSKGTAYVQQYNYSRDNGDNFFYHINQYYPAMMFVGLFLVFIFILFYNFLTRKKGW